MRFGIYIIIALAFLGCLYFYNGRQEAEIALAYQCGYRLGQIEMVKLLPEALQKVKPPAVACPYEQSLAVRHGFIKQ